MLCVCICMNVRCGSDCVASAAEAALIRFILRKIHFRNQNNTQSGLLSVKRQTNRLRNCLQIDKLQIKAVTTDYLRIMLPVTLGSVSISRKW